MTAHVAIHMRGAWGVLPIFVSGIAYGRVWFTRKDKGCYQSAKEELFDIATFLIPGLIGVVILISAIFTYGA